MSGQPKTYIAGLDGLRAICITLVILGHLGFGALVPGGLGVTVFFFISGFLITRLLWQERDRNGGLDLWRFYGRRMLRLLPELLVLLAVLGLLGPVLHQPLTLLRAFGALAYWTNYLNIAGLDTCDHCAVVGHLWSLAVEEHFYVVMPLTLIACAFAPRRLATVCLLVFVATLAWRLIAFTRLHLPEIYTYEATECRLDSIAWGCFAAVAERSWPNAMAWVRRHGRAVFGYGVALLLASLSYREEVFRATFRYSLQGLALVGVILPLAISPKLSRLVALLEWAPLRWMGRRSYAAYLWHYTALNLAGLAVGVVGALEAASHKLQLEALPMVLICTWILAELSYRFVYTPSQRLKPWLLPKRGPVVVEEIAGAPL
ncbi:MAG: acyltransferase family protein [Caulobacteraceae bacterium]